MTKNQDLIRRATAAYFRSGGLNAPSKSSVVFIERSYVALSFHGQTLAVYRVENSGRLKRLKRWPALVAAPMPKVFRVTEEDMLKSVTESLLSGDISGAFQAVANA